MNGNELLAEIAKIWDRAQARMDAGEPTQREIRLAYSMPPGDSEIAPRAWLTEFESERLHELGLLARPVLQAEAEARLAARLVTRGIPENLNSHWCRFPPESVWRTAEASSVDETHE